MDKTYITWQQLKEALKNVNNDVVRCACHFTAYEDWQRLEHENEACLQFLGGIVDNEGKEHLTMEMYPGKYELMALMYYPYGGCNVHQCSLCNRLFFVYREMGGHAAEVRCRWIREELLVFEA